MAHVLVGWYSVWHSRLMNSQMSASLSDAGTRRSARRCAVSAGAGPRANALGCHPVSVTPADHNAGADADVHVAHAHA